jgi:hypothetical protein
MNTVKAIGSGIKNFMILFSFIVNLVLIVVVVGLILFIFDIKNNIVTPLVSGLHSSFVGLNEATIDWTIPVRDQIPVVLNIPLETDTIVTLTQPVPLIVGANISLGAGNNLSATVNLTLPEGLQLPVALDLDVPVNQDLDVALDVRAVIPLAQTQLDDPIQNLRLVFDPLNRALYNLPDNVVEAGGYISRAVSGSTINLLDPTERIPDPWLGFSRTAGLHYDLAFEPVPVLNIPVQTNIVPPGGIPALDEQVRPDIPDPNLVNAQAAAVLDAQSIPAHVYDGSYSEWLEAERAERAAQGGAP